MAKLAACFCVLPIHAGLQLSAPTTSVFLDARSTSLYKEGFIIALSLEDGSTGYDEIATFGAQEEDMQHLEDELHFLIYTLKGVGVSYHFSLLRGSYSSWIKRSLGFPVQSISPSVRCGLEMAILNAIAARQKSSLFSILSPGNYVEKNYSECTSSIQICGLIDHKGTPKEVADVSYKLVDEGFYTIKLKVARRLDPKEDAAVVQEVRMKVGPNVNIRIDANLQWTLDEAIEFCSLIKECNLQYIEFHWWDKQLLLEYCRN